MQIFVKTLTGKTPSPWPDGCVTDKSPPRTTSLRIARQVRLRLVRGALTHNLGVTNHEGVNLHVMRKQ
jgi:hypothetical protein